MRISGDEWRRAGKRLEMAGTSRVRVMCVEQDEEI